MGPLCLFVVVNYWGESLKQQVSLKVNFCSASLYLFLAVYSLYLVSLSPKCKMVIISNLQVSLTQLSIADLLPRAQSSHGQQHQLFWTGFNKQQTSHRRLFVSDSSGMWEEHEEEEAEDDDEEDEGLAGQLLSDLIASNKYGTSVSPVPRLFLYFILNSVCFVLKLLPQNFISGY